MTGDLLRIGFGREELPINIECECATLDKNRKAIGLTQPTMDQSALPTPTNDGEKNVSPGLWI